MTPEDDDGGVGGMAAMTPEDENRGVGGMAAMTPEDDDGGVRGVPAMTPEDEDCEGWQNKFVVTFSILPVGNLYIV